MFFFNKKNDNQDYYVIVGLGNKGNEYKNTRHNVGFIYVDELIKKMDSHKKYEKFDSIYYKGTLFEHNVIIVKPQTYMNLSGKAVQGITSYFKVDTSKNLLVVYDDINLNLSNIRIRKSGSAGGHNGIKDIIKMLSSNEFNRIRIGIGMNDGGNLVNHVLGHFSDEELIILNKAIESGIEATKLILDGNIDKAMNNYNKRHTS